MRHLLAVALMLACGCSNSRFVEGTSTTIGLYVPTGEGLVGLQCVEYLNGVKVNVYTNQPFTVERVHCSSNSYFGIVRTVESSSTKVQVK